MGARRADEFIPLKPAYFHILLTVAHEPVHGYGIRREVEERTNGRIVLAAGTLYETLQRLERSGLIVEVEPQAGDQEAAGSRWRFFTATALGRSVVKQELTRLEADVAAARAHLGSRAD